MPELKLINILTPSILSKNQSLIILFLIGLIIFTGCSVNSNDNELQSNTEISVYAGEVKWNPERFYSLPDTTDFEMNVSAEQVLENQEKKLEMKISLYNPTADTIYLTTGATSVAGEVYYDFVIIDDDSLRVWNRLPANIRTSLLYVITLEPEEEKVYRQLWDYTNYEGEMPEAGEYYFYAGIESLGISEKFGADSKRLYEHKSNSEYNDGGMGQGVGYGPIVISVE